MEYVFLFITLYFQIFFLVTFIDNSDVFFVSKKRKKFRNLPLVSMIVPCWNEEETVVATVETIRALNYPQSKIEIIVVDDGSTDGTWDEMQKLKHFKNVRIFTKENGGKHTANNLGIKESTGEYIATIDADTFLKEDALCEIMYEFRNDKDLDSIGSTILVKNPKTIIQYAQMIEYQMFSVTKVLLALIQGALVVPGAFSVYKRSVFDRIGYFIDGHKLEDLELTYRMQHHGMKVGQTHKAIAYTNAPDSFAKLWSQRKRWGYGFLRNTYDYKSMFFNKKNHNFGFFTLPMSLFTYLAILVAFSITLVLTTKKILEIILEVRLLGFDSLTAYFSNIGEFSFSPTLLIYLIIYLSILFIIIFGKSIVGENTYNPFPVISFFIIYSTFVPFLVLKNIYDSITSSTVKWR